MNRIPSPLPLLACVSVLGATVCMAQDTPDRPVPAPAAAEKPGESDSVALAYLEEAAETQGGAALAAPGALRSFRVEFSRGEVRQAKKQVDGTTFYAWEELSRLEIDWKRNAGKPSSLRTFWEMNGKVLTLAVIGDEDYYWENDGQQTTQIQEATHPDDVDQIHRYRRLSESLLDVAVLHKLRQDGSIWTRVEDTAHEGIALRRTPPEGGNGLKLTIWIDPNSSEVKHVRLDPIEDGASTLHYELAYMKDRPVVSGADLRFPQHVIVHEQRIAEQRPQKVMELRLQKVFFNAVADDVFYPPKQ